jgi:serine/threonine protein kinase
MHVTRRTRRRTSSPLPPGILPTEFGRLQSALPKRYTLLREQLPDRDVAIKVLAEERFVREVELTSQLGHTHIVPIHAAGDANGSLYYVMPYIDGESLRGRLRREGRLPIDEALKITQQIAKVLQYAHDKEIVHCAIKPSNILSLGGHPLLADFGIARALRAARDGADFTQGIFPLGTPDYMSPEQARGNGPVDGRTDTYALACLLYEMLAGQPPFHSRTSQATLPPTLPTTCPRCGPFEAPCR